jgi:hypothetical protein
MNKFENEINNLVKSHYNLINNSNKIKSLKVNSNGINYFINYDLNKYNKSQSKQNIFNSVLSTLLNFDKIVTSSVIYNNLINKYILDNNEIELINENNMKIKYNKINNLKSIQKSTTSKKSEKYILANNLNKTNNNSLYSFYSNEKYNINESLFNIYKMEANMNINNNNNNNNLSYEENIHEITINQNIKILFIEQLFLDESYLNNLTNSDKSNKSNLYIRIQFNYYVTKNIQQMKLLSYIFNLINQIITHYLFLSNNFIKMLDLYNFKKSNQISSLFNNPGGMDNETISKLNLRYSLTEKADGLRYLIYITSNSIYLVSNKGIITCVYSIYLNNIIRVLKLKSLGTEYDFKKSMDLLKKYNNTLLDGELINEELFLFDCVSIKGRKTYNLKLLERLSVLNEFVNFTDINKILSLIKLKTKIHYFNIDTLQKDEEKYITLSKNGDLKNCVFIENFIEKCNELWKNRTKLFPYELDGLIFTPIDSVYLSKFRNNTSLKLILKWKENTTVDVRIFWNKNKKVWEFFSYDYDGNVVEIFEFDKYNYNPKLDNNTKTKNLANKFEDGLIVEFEYNKEQEQFVPFKIRDDKIKPNSLLTIKSSIDIGINPIMMNDLMAFLKSVKDAKFGEIYYQEKREEQDARENAIDINMRKFHNYIKKYIINYYTNNNLHKQIKTNNIIKTNNVDKTKLQKEKIFLLDFSAGRGGDMYKYIQSKVDVVLGIDISGEAISQASEQWNNLKSEYPNKDFYFIEGDSTLLFNKTQNTNYKTQEFYKNIPTKSQKVLDNFISKYSNNNFNNLYNLFDITISSFSVHYYFSTTKGSNNFLKNLNYLTKPGGIFVGTILDGSILDKQLNNNNIFTAVKDEQIIYNVIKENTKTESGMPIINVWRPGWDLPIPEPLLYENNFMKSINAMNFKTINFDNFNTIYNNHKLENNKRLKLSDSEKSVSFMHKFFVFQKQPINITNSKLSKKKSKTKKISSKLTLLKSKKISKNKKSNKTKKN